MLFATAEPPGEYTVKYRAGKRSPGEQGGKDLYATTLMLKLPGNPIYTKNERDSLFFWYILNILFPLPLSWFTVTNKALPVLPALIGLGGVQLSESASLTERTVCWLSLSEHAHRDAAEGAGTHSVWL